MTKNDLMLSSEFVTNQVMKADPTEAFTLVEPPTELVKKAKRIPRLFTGILPSSFMVGGMGSFLVLVTTNSSPALALPALGTMFLLFVPVALSDKVERNSQPYKALAAYDQLNAERLRIWLAERYNHTNVSGEWLSSTVQTMKDGQHQQWANDNKVFSLEKINERNWVLTEKPNVSPLPIKDREAPVMTLPVAKELTVDKRELEVLRPLPAEVEKVMERIDGIVVKLHDCNLSVQQQHDVTSFIHDKTKIVELCRQMMTVDAGMDMSSIVTSLSAVEQKLTGVLDATVKNLLVQADLQKEFVLGRVAQGSELVLTDEA